MNSLPVIVAAAALALGGCAHRQSPEDLAISQGRYSHPVSDWRKGDRQRIERMTDTERREAEAFYFGQDYYVPGRVRGFRDKTLDTFIHLNSLAFNSMNLDVSVSLDPMGVTASAIDTVHHARSARQPLKELVQGIKTSKEMGLYDAAQDAQTAGYDFARIDSNVQFNLDHQLRPFLNCSENSENERRGYHGSHLEIIRFISEAYLELGNDPLTASAMPKTVAAAQKLYDEVTEKIKGHDGERAYSLLFDGKPTRARDYNASTISFVQEYLNWKDGECLLRKKRR